ncbi:hypothetical protein JP0475_08240 [Helicobacter pylori]|nr:hypothetical protein JP0126_10130 [Helicobacter pylori]
MGFQNENQLKVGALVKATINDKVVEAKVISIGFNRVTLRSEKGNEVSYAFNSEKFLKWFHKVDLNEVAKNHAESGKKDILEGLKIVTSGLSVKKGLLLKRKKADISWTLISMVRKKMRRLARFFQLRACMLIPREKDA